MKANTKPQLQTQARPPEAASMTGHALCVSRPSKGGVHIKLRLEDVMADRSSNNSRDNKIRLERWFQKEKGPGNGRPPTLYVMNTSMRKKETKTVAPYNPARRIREASGTVDLRRA